MCDSVSPQVNGSPAYSHSMEQACHTDSDCFLLFHHSLTMLREASDEPAALRESGVPLAEGSRCTEDPKPCPRGPETSQCRKEPAEDPGQLPSGLPTLVNVRFSLLKQSPCRRHPRGYLFPLLHQDWGSKADWRLSWKYHYSASKALYSFTCQEINLSFILGKNSTRSLISLNVLWMLVKSIVWD